LTERQVGVFWTTDMHSACGPKMLACYFLDNSVKNKPILIVFAHRIPKKFDANGYACVH